MRRELFASVVARGRGVEVVAGNLGVWEFVELCV